MNITRWNYVVGPDETVVGGFGISNRRLKGDSNHIFTDCQIRLNIEFVSDEHIVGDGQQLSIQEDTTNCIQAVENQEYSSSTQHRVIHLRLEF